MDTAFLTLDILAPCAASVQRQLLLTKWPSPSLSGLRIPEMSARPVISKMRHLALLVVALLVVSPDRVCAQEAVDRWSQMNATAGATVHVLLDEGTEVSGRLLRLDPASLVLLVEGSEHRFEQAHVRRVVRRGDSLRNGALIGAGVGAVIGLFATRLADCPAPDRGGPCPGTRAAGFALAVGAYSAIGVGIDAIVVGRTTVYESTARPSGATRDRTRESRALRLSVRW